MKTRLLSDLHIEFFQREPYRPTYHGEDVLVLAGDVDVGAYNALDVMERFLAVGVPRIVYVTGNHEYYNEDFDEVNAILAKELDNHPTISYLNRRSVTIGDVTFIGATLWTNFNNEDISAMSAAAKGISDFRVIKRNGGKFTTNDAIQEYYKDIEFIKSAYSSTQGKKVIVTHFLPDMSCSHPKYRYGGVINHYFANNLGNYISSLEDTTWVYGHTHECMDKTIGTTRVVCNPKGYPHEFTPYFRDDFMMEL